MRSISVTELKHALDERTRDSSFVLIDVRSPEEYAEGHIAGSVNVPLDTLPEELALFEGTKTAYMQCRSGGRSAYAIAYLQSSSVTAELVNVEGGILAWQRSGFPVDR